jgi:hypothetical protein
MDSMKPAIERIERWGCFEVRLRAQCPRNPFTDAFLEARFSNGARVSVVDGFYDGDETWVVRFMPEQEGTWTFRTKSGLAGLDGIGGSFECVPASGANHGPVQVRDSTNFAYADGTPYWPVGTTCYAWNHQGRELEERTLATLKHAPFNKLRMCVFPKRYLFNENEPESYPFEGGLTGTWDRSMIGRFAQQPLARWDFDRFNPAYFRKLEARILDLQRLGIEADLILFHPYDFGAWGFDCLPRGVNERYLRYVVSRLSAFRNVWWSLANEYDLMRGVTMEDWDAYFRLVRDRDPYGHLRSIHNCFGFYDHSQPWVTHASIQSSDLAKADQWIKQYWKPVVFDECCYEGNIQMAWGDITAREMVHRFWLGFSRGAYVGHGETYENPEQQLWWSKGGVLKGESPARIAFLRTILEQSGLPGLKPLLMPHAQEYQHGFVAGGHDGISRHGDDCYLAYFGERQPAKRWLNLGSASYRIDLIDTWGMAVRPLGTFTGRCEVALPGTPHIALRAVRERR